MHIDWDEQKNKRNQAKYHVSFELAQLLVAHTYQESVSGEAVRIISARKATKREQQHYEKCIG